MKRRKILKFISLAAVICLFISGCARYSSEKLPPPSSICLREQTVDHGLRIYAKALSKQETEKVLGRDVLAKGYQPVQLYLENHTDKTYLFKKNGISLPLAEGSDVARKVHTSTLGRTAGYGAAAIFLTPIFAIPAIVDGLGSVKANEILDHDYLAKEAKDQPVFPYSQTNMIFFVPVAAYQPSFSVILIEENTQKQKRLIASAG